MPVNISDYPLILDRILTYTPWSALPALRATSKELAKFANATLWNHVVVAPHGPVLAITDPYTRRRVPGLRFEGSHTGPTLRRITEFTDTVDLVGDAEALRQHPLWFHFRQLAETKRIRATQAICDLLINPKEVVLQFDVDVERPIIRLQPGHRFKRLLVFVPINNALVAPRRYANNGRFLSASQLLVRCDEVVIVFVPGASEPDSSYLPDDNFVYWPLSDTEPRDNTHCRPFDLIITQAINPSVERSVTLVGMETSIHTRMATIEGPSSEALVLHELRHQVAELQDVY